MKNVMLYFGSFNPIHKGHIAIAEYAVEHKLCDEVILIVSPQNPHKAAPELAAELQRFEMAEIACSESRFPENNTYINLVPPGLYGDPSQDPHLREVTAEEAEKITFFAYEELLAFKRAAEKLGITVSELIL